MQEESKWFDTTELANRVAQKITESKEAAQYFDNTADLVKLILNAAFLEVAKEVGKCERAVILDNIGTFQLEGRQARKHTNPQTGEPLEKPAYQKFKFYPAKALRSVAKEHLPEKLNGFEVK